MIIIIKSTSKISALSLNPDTEPEIIINPDTREIIIPKELYNIGVVADDNAELVKIRIPRYFDDNDFSLRECTISFNNAANERGVYFVKQVDVEIDSLLIYWSIEKFVTKKAGKISFIVEFKKEIDDRGMSYSWSTISAEMCVLPGLDDKIIIDERDISLYQTLLKHIQANDFRVSELINKFETLYEINITIELIKNQIIDLQHALETLTTNVAYIEPTIMN